MILKQQRDIIQAAIDGKQIQARSTDKTNYWRDANPVIFNFSNYEYRVKPEPREFWINYRDSMGDEGFAYSTRARADEAANSNRTSVIKVREVIDEE